MTNDIGAGYDHDKQLERGGYESRRFRGLPCGMVNSRQDGRKPSKRELVRIQEDLKRRLREQVEGML